MPDQSDSIIAMQRLGDHKHKVDHERLLRERQEKINEYGYTLIGVFSTVTEPIDPFMYTAGLMGLGHPELITFSLPVEVAMTILTDACEGIKDGQTIGPYDERDDLVHGYPVRFLPVAPTKGEEYLTIARHFNGGEPVPALQMVFPDQDNRWPWEPQCAFAGKTTLIGQPK